jgi:hypothetical protein
VLTFDIETAGVGFSDTCPECDAIVEWPGDEAEAFNQMFFNQDASAHDFTVECDKCGTRWTVVITAMVHRTGVVSLKIEGDDGSDDD